MNTAVTCLALHVAQHDHQARGYLLAGTHDADIHIWPLSDLGLEFVCEATLEEATLLEEEDSTIDGIRPRRESSIGFCASPMGDFVRSEGIMPEDLGTPHVGQDDTFADTFADTAAASSSMQFPSDLVELPRVGEGAPGRINSAPDRISTLQVNNAAGGRAVEASALAALDSHEHASSKLAADPFARSARASSDRRNLRRPASLFQADGQTGTGDSPAVRRRQSLPAGPSHPRRRSLLVGAASIGATKSNTLGRSMSRSRPSSVHEGSTPGSARSSTSSMFSIINRSSLGGENNATSTVISGHAKAVRCLVVLDNDVLVSGSDDQTIKVWSLTGEDSHTCQMSMGKGMSLHRVLGLTSLGGSLIASCGESLPTRFIWATCTRTLSWCTHGSILLATNVLAALVAHTRCSTPT